MKQNEKIVPNDNAAIGGEDKENARDDESRRGDLRKSSRKITESKRYLEDYATEQEIQGKKFVIICSRNGKPWAFVGLYH